MFANRMKLVLPHFIAETQSAFVPERLITDNIVLANEVVHFMKGQRRGLVGYAALKIDTAKAYDKIEWDYLTTGMRSIGLYEGWVAKMQMCFATA